MMQVGLRVQGAAGPQRVTLEAASEAEAIRLASRRGLRVLSIERPAQKPGGLRHAAFPLSLFSQELLTLLEAGLTLVEALDTLRAKERAAGARALLESVCTDLAEGKRF